MQQLTQQSLLSKCIYNGKAIGDRRQEHRQSGNTADSLFQPLGYICIIDGVGH